jgi:hypothetical protein
VGGEIGLRRVGAGWRGVAGMVGTRKGWFVRVVGGKRGSARHPAHCPAVAAADSSLCWAEGRGVWCRVVVYCLLSNSLERGARPAWNGGCELSRACVEGKTGLQYQRSVEPRLVERRTDGSQEISFSARLVKQNRMRSVANSPPGRWRMLSRLQPLHLLVQPDADQLSRQMRKLGISCTKAINKRYGRVGPLFQGQFRAVRVDGNEYVLRAPFS